MMALVKRQEEEGVNVQINFLKIGLKFCSIIIYNNSFHLSN